MDQPFPRPLRSNGPEERLHPQVLRHARLHGIAHQFAVEEILDAGKVEPAFIGGDLGEVRHPGFVWSRNGELPIQQVWRHRQGMIRIRGRLEFPFLQRRPSFLRIRLIR